MKRSTRMNATHHTLSDSAPPWKRAVLIYACIVVLSMLLYGRLSIGSDGVSYYAVAESLAQDFDIDLENQQYLQDFSSYAVQHNPRTSHYISSYSAGTGLFHFPILASAIAFEKMTGLFAEFGFNPLRAAAILISNGIYAFLGLCMVFFVIRRYLRISDNISPLLILFSTSYFFYTFSEPSFSHSVDTFSVTLVLFLFAFREKCTVRNVNVSPILLGFAMGLMVLVRNVNVVLIVPYILFFAWEAIRKRITLREFLRTSVGVVLGGLPALLFLLYYNNYYYGSPLTGGYAGSGLMTTTPQFFFHYYLHPVRGLLWWAPVTIFSLLGFRSLYNANRELFRISILSLICFSILFAFCIVYTAAQAYGQRFFTCMYPFLAVGLAAFFIAHRHKVFRVLAYGATLFSFIVMNFFLININTAAGNHTLLNIPYTQSDLIRTGVNAYRNEATPYEQNPLIFAFDRIFGGTSPTLGRYLYGYVTGDAPIFLRNIDVSYVPEEITFHAPTYSIGSQRAVQFIVDFEDASDTRSLFAVVSPDITIPGGTHDYIFSCRPRTGCSFPGIDGTVEVPHNLDLETALDRSTVFKVHIVMRDPKTGMQFIKIVESYYQSAQNDFADDVSPLHACPDDDRCLGGEREWRFDERDGAFVYDTNGTQPGILVARLSPQAVDQNHDGILDTSVTFRVQLKIREDNIRGGFNFVRWKADGTMTPYFREEYYGGITYIFTTTANRFAWLDVVMAAGETAVFPTDNPQIVEVRAGINGDPSENRIMVKDFVVQLSATKQ